MNRYKIPTNINKSDFMDPDTDFSQYRGSPTKASVILLGCLFISGAMNWVYQVVMGWLLPRAEYGRLGVSIAILNILLIAISSIFPILVTKFISETSLTLADQHRVMKTSLLGNIMIGIGVGLGLVLVFFYFFQSILVAYTPMIFLIWAILLSFSVEFVFSGLLQGFFKFENIAIAYLIEYVIKVVVAVFLVLLGGGAFYGLLGYLIGMVFGILYEIFILRRFKFWREKGWTNAHINRFVIPLFFGTFGASILMNIDLILLRLLLNSDQLAGEYQAVITLSRIPVYLLGTVGGAIFPYISYRTAQGGKPYELIGKALKFSILLALPIAVSFTLIPEGWLSAIYPNYISGAWVVRILAGGYFFLALVVILISSFQALNKPKIPALVLPIVVIIDIIIIVILGSLFGMAGIAWGTTTSCLMGFVILLVIYRQCCPPSKTRPLFQKMLYLFRIGICLLIYIFTTLFLPQPLQQGLIIDFIVMWINYGGSMIIFCLMLAITSVVTAEELEEIFRTLSLKGRIPTFLQNFVLLIVRQANALFSLGWFKKKRN